MYKTTTELRKYAQNAHNYLTLMDQRVYVNTDIMHSHLLSINFQLHALNVIHLVPLVQDKIKINA